MSLFDILVAFPLTRKTYADALQACLLTSSHETLLRLRPHNPDTGMEMLSDSDVNTDDAIVVTNGEEVEAVLNGAFRVDITIKDFQKRMRLSKEVSVEFIARGKVLCAICIVLLLSALQVACGPFLSPSTHRKVTITAGTSTILAPGY